jgi:deoxyribodipyrimidine photo-lyase
MNVHIHWFRRDLRLHDHRALYEAAKQGLPIVGLFIFDKEILDKLDDPKDMRVQFIHDALSSMKSQLEEKGSSLIVKYGTPLQVWKDLLSEYDVQSVSAVRDYEPYAKERDKQVYDFLQTKNIKFAGYKDQVIFEKSEVVKQDGGVYTVFTPYRKTWEAKLRPEDYQDFSVDLESFHKMPAQAMPSLSSMGFEQTSTEHFPGKNLTDNLIKNYHDTRNLPYVKGTSRLSVHLRFGTISIRELVRRAVKLNDTFLSELIWRDFYQMTLYHFPESVNKAIKPKYDRIEWENNEAHFQAWCEGKTGYPLVDAGMRELNTTGYMHNRVRMVVASFLTKHLLIDWRWGERYFAAKLLDFDLSANVGGWQWAAGCGNDAAPYFRVFNPTTQAEKFDPENKYIKTFVKEYGTKAYPEPIVEHKFARERVLARFKEALNS